MESQVLHTVWCNITGETAGEIWSWSLLGVKGLKSNVYSKISPDSCLTTDRYVSNRLLEPMLESKCNAIWFYSNDSYEADICRRHVGVQLVALVAHSLSTPHPTPQGTRNKTHLIILRYLLSNVIFIGLQCK